MSVLPDALPAIDFSAYKGKVPVAGMVEEFEKQYKALTIPYPEEKYKPAIDGQAKEYVSFVCYMSYVTICSFYL